MAFSSYARDKNRRTNKLLQSIEEKHLKQKMDQAAEDKTLKEMRKLNRKIDKLQITFDSQNRKLDKLQSTVDCLYDFLQEM